MVPAPDHVADMSVGGWIEPRLGVFGSVGGLVPLGFETYLRVGRGRSDPELATGSTGVDRHTLRILSDVLVRLGTGRDCLFAIWEGYGWIHGGRGIAPAFPHVVLTGPKLSLPNRNYFLFEGPLVSALEFREPGGWGCPSPDLIWPRDQSWFIATDTDLWFAYVGASRDLAREVVAQEQLDTEPVRTTGMFADVEPH